MSAVVVVVIALVVAGIVAVASGLPIWVLATGASVGAASEEDLRPVVVEVAEPRPENFD